MFIPSWTVEDLRPIFDTILSAFGAERCMFGSNFPVDSLYGDYQSLWRAYAELCKRLDANETFSLFGNTAAEFYRLQIDDPRETGPKDQ